MRTTNRVPPPLIWYISQIIVDVLSLVVNACVLNQFRGHWLLFNVLSLIVNACVLKKFRGHWIFSNVLNAIITMNLKLKE